MLVRVSPAVTRLTVYRRRQVRGHRFYLANTIAQIDLSANFEPRVLETNAINFDETLSEHISIYEASSAPSLRFILFLTKTLC